MESRERVNEYEGASEPVLTSICEDSGQGFTSYEVQVEESNSPERETSIRRTPCTEMLELHPTEDECDNLPTPVDDLNGSSALDIECSSVTEAMEMLRGSTLGMKVNDQVRGVVKDLMVDVHDRIGRASLQSGDIVAMKMSDTNISINLHSEYSRDHLEFHLETRDDECISGTNTSRGRSSSEAISLLSSPERETIEDAEERRKSLICAATAADVPKFKWGNLDEEGIEQMEQMEQMEEVILSGPNGLLETPRLSSQMTPDVGMDPEQSKESEKQLEDGGQGLSGLALLASSGTVSHLDNAAAAGLSAQESCTNWTKVVPKVDVAKEPENKAELEKGELSLVKGVEAKDAYSLRCSQHKKSDTEMTACDEFLKCSYHRNPASGSLATATPDVSVASLSDPAAHGARDKIDIEKDLKLKHKAVDRGACKYDIKSLVTMPSRASCESPRAGLEFQRQSFSRNSGGLQEGWRLEPFKTGENGMTPKADDRDCKDWFRQRLWCYLFENLSRAIDELYFLCDLQGDMDKMNEALLVFDEAGLEFKELKSCFGGVANVKKAATLLSPRSPASSISSVSGLGENHQRRPHAIAWEVHQAAPPKFRIEIREVESKAVNELQAVEQAAKVQERQASATVRDGKDLNSVPESPRVRAASALSCPVDEETWKMEDFEDSFTKKRKLSKKMIQNQLIGRLMRPTESSNIRVATTSRDKEKEKQRERDKDHSWSIGTKTAVEPWKEKRNWVDILATPRQMSRGQGLDRASAKNVDLVHDEPRLNKAIKNTGSDHNEDGQTQTGSTKTRMHTDVEQVRQSQRSSKKQQYGDEGQAVQSNRLQEGMHGPQQRGESRQGGYTGQGASINSGRNFVTSIQEEDKKVSFKQNLSSNLQRVEKVKSKQKEDDSAREEAAQERLRLQEARKKRRIADSQLRKQEGKAMREDNWRSVFDKRGLSIFEQVHKRVARAESHEEESEHVEQKLAERLRNSAQRRLAYLEQIMERIRPDIEKEAKCSLAGSFGEVWEQGSLPSGQPSDKERVASGHVGHSFGNFTGICSLQRQAMKKRVKKIRQKLASKKIHFLEPSPGEEGLGIGSATVAGLARFKIGRWMEDLRRVQQAKDLNKSLTTSVIISEIVKCLEQKDPELHAARQQGLLDYAAVSIPIPCRASETTLSLLQIQRVLLYLPANCSYFITRNLLPPLVPMLTSSLEIFSTYGKFFQESGSKSVGTKAVGKVHENLQEKLTREGELDILREVLEGLLSSTASIMGHPCNEELQLSMQDDLADLLVACELIHRLRNFFAVFDWPQGERASIPSPIFLGLKLLEAMTGSKRKSLLPAHEEPINVMVHKSHVHQAQFSNRGQDSEQPGHHMDSPREGGVSVLAAMGTDLREDKLRHERQQTGEKKRTDLVEATPRIVITQKGSTLAQSTTFLVAAISETGLVGLPSLLSGILLQADPQSPDQAACALPPNFNEVATMVLQVLNNVARLDLPLLQNKLALPDVRMEFYHLVSFLLTHCTCNWKTSSDEIAGLLLETLLLLGYAALLHPGNQAVLRWGRSPTILHKMCDLPFAFFSDPKLTPILIGTLLAVCYGSETNRDVVQQELSMDMLLAFLKSLKLGLIQPPVTQAPDSKPQIKEAPKKAKTKTVYGIKNPDLDSDTPRYQSRKKIPLPEAFFSPSKSLPVPAKPGSYSTSPSTPRCSRRGNTACRSSTRCSMSSPVLDVPPLPKKTIRKGNSSVSTPRLSSRNVDTGDGTGHTLARTLPIAFALRNRFPEGLWNLAEEFFSSGSWMGQIVKCL